jgi:uncharacterized phage protein gp47/JayE
MAIRRNYLQIVQDGKTRLEKNSPVNNFNSQGLSKALLDVLGVEVERQYNTLEYIYNAVDPTKAVGSDLEKIGFMVGESRNDAVTATDSSVTNFYFFIDQRINTSLSNLIKNNYNAEERNTLINKGYLIVDANNNITSLKIPKDHIIFNINKSISYATINDVNLTDEDSYVGIIATSTGPQNNVQTNSLVYHSIQQIPELRKISQYIKCTNRFPIQTGSNSMTDADYRYKIATSRSAIRANELSIRRAALSVPGIRDILFEKNKYGNGTVNIVVDGISPLISQGLIDTVKERIQLELSYGDTVFVEKPEYLGVEINIGIILEPGTSDELSVRQQVRNNIIQYINDLPIGGEIIWNKIIDLSFNVEGVRDVVPKIFKYGEYDALNKMNRNQIILRFHNQKADLLSKWYTDLGMCGVCII